MTSRTWTIARLDLAHGLRRPLVWILILLLGLSAWGMSTGKMRIGTGDATVGGTKAFITSEFANAQVLSILALMFYGFFVAVALGMTLIRDDETRIGDLLHATPLTPRQYIRGKFLGGFATFVAVVVAHVALLIFFNHALVDADSAEFIGPLSLASYARPAAIFVLPTLLFVGGTSFWIGERWRKPIVVFFAPLALVLLCVFFLWVWSPSWLDPRINQALMLLDPTGYRWLKETHLLVDRGVAFYNSAAIPLDLPFVASRVGFALLGLLAVASSGRHFARRLRGVRFDVSAQTLAQLAQARPASPPPTHAGLAALRMGNRPPGQLRGALEVARIEFRELRGQPGLYLFVPLIVLEAVANSVFATGAFDTPLLHTPGTLAVGAMGFLTTLTCLLLMFYVVESLRREDSSGLRPIHSSTPVRTSTVLLGKMLANSLVGVVAMGATLLVFVIVLLVQGKVAFDLWPFVLVWGLLLPTLLLWSSFVTAVYAFANNRYTTYGVALATLMLTGYFAVRDDLTWLTNWPLWGTLQWTDMGVLELAREPLLYNRLLALMLTLLFVVVTLRIYPRRQFDATRIVHRLRPAALGMTLLQLSPFVVAPALLGFYIHREVNAGFGGDRYERAAKDYWRKNVLTYRNFPTPDLASVDVAVELDPARRGIHSRGTFELVNGDDAPLDRVLLSAGRHWQTLRWTLDGADYQPENRQNLFVFTPPQPLARQGTIRIGFDFDGVFPEGWTKNGGGAGEFVLPAGVVLTSFTGSFVPIVGYRDDVGVDEDNRADAKEYRDDFFAGVTRSAFGSGRPFSVRTSITAPAEYTLNGVGTRLSDTVDGDRRTTIWQSDHPVRFFNVVAGRWAERRGQGTAIYHHPAHTYNVDEMIETLDAARLHYSQWFHPYPWQELKLSEFPALASYAQGFPTNITFSEGIGFLTRSDPESNAAFMVTAHEAAHQWWGNLLCPGDGPGGNVLSEGMAHFSTILLFDQVKGIDSRIGFCKLIEARYGDNRSADSERPLVKTDGSRPGDTTVTYDKGGWVFWMLLNLMGREPTLAGLQAFVAHYQDERDHPVLQDFVAHMRRFATDTAAYDAFVQQWFFDVSVPEYRLQDASLARQDDGWQVNVRVTNAGTGRMPVVIAAERGVRFTKVSDDAGGGRPADASLALEDAGAGGFQDARTTLELGPGDSAEVSLACAFEPERIVIDPDCLVLQLQRKLAIHRF